MTYVWRYVRFLFWAWILLGVTLAALALVDRSIRALLLSAGNQVLR